MPSLAVVRHAKSDWSHALPDDGRPLNPRGRRDAPAVGRWLAESFTPIDLVLCSTAVRTRETLQLAGLTAAKVTYDERIYAAAYEELVGVLEEVPDEVGRAVLIGHNPGLSDLVTFLTAEQVEMRTSAIAVLAWTGGWADVWSRSASLVSHATPRG